MLTEGYLYAVLRGRWRAVSEEKGGHGSGLVEGGEVEAGVAVDVLLAEERICPRDVRQYQFGQGESVLDHRQEKRCKVQLSGGMFVPTYIVESLL